MHLLRLAVALATTVPDVTLRVRWDHGGAGIISSHPSADMSPDDLRLLTVSAFRFGNDRVVSHIVDLDIRSGLTDLGGGVYAPAEDDPGTTTRYVVGSLSDDQLDTLLRPRRDDDPSVAVEVHCDRALGTSIIEVSAPTSAGAALEDVTARLNAEVLVAELLTLAEPTTSP